MAASLGLRYAAKSDVGLVRQGNEDSGYVGPRLLLVADGMGGHAAGELASSLAIATVADLDVHPPTNADVLTSLAEAIDNVGDAIGELIADDPDLTGMGTTITGLYWLGGRIAVVHVGDSRAYLFRDNELIQLTHDHTYVQTLVDSGRITEEEASVHPRRSLLMRALDGMNPVEADLSVREARSGDRFLLCSDGLSGVVRDTEIADLLSTGEPTGVVTRLVDLALERGAPDNVTVVVADVVERPADEELPLTPPVVVGAAGEPRVRLQLPNTRFPDDAQPDPDRPDAPAPIDGGPETAPQILIDSALIVPAAEQARYDAEAAEIARTDKKIKRRKVMGIVGGILVVAAITAGTLFGIQSWVTSQWYVAINGSAGTGTVAIYNGVQGSLAGIKLSGIDTDSGLMVGSLPLFDQELVSKGIPAASYADAQRIVAELQSRAAECQALIPPQGCPGSLQ
ncbi:MAG: PP2C family serine/threonine-protein phosphatase [Candidatus Nanopelagicales bacterium]